MTRDEILNMPAGRELDALVAEKVMGWHKLDGNWKDDIWEKVDGHIKGDWHPSEDISVAWEVVEKLRLYVMPFGSKDWCVSKTRNFRGAFENIVVDDTAPPAICRAALLAVMESEK